MKTSGGCSMGFLGGACQAHQTQRWLAAFYHESHESAPGIVSRLQFTDMLNKYNLIII
jgi:hypothetical protein